MNTSDMLCVCVCVRVCVCVFACTFICTSGFSDSSVCPGLLFWSDSVTSQGRRVALLRLF